MKILADDFAKEDLIGHSIYCDGLIEIIKNVDSSSSFTIGVFGKWGTGKTSLLRQLELKLEDDKEILTIWFNPWQFAAEKHLIIPFFHNLIISLEEKSIEHKYKEKIVSFLEKILNIPFSLLYGMEGELKLAFIKLKYIHSKAVNEQTKKEKEIDDKDLKSNKVKLLEKYESLYYNLIQELQNAIEELNLKIVIFIDDLDRCLPEKAIELLEGFKVLLDLKGFVFVVGVDNEIIKKGIRVRYNELYKSSDNEYLNELEERYLDKIIQFPFALPMADSNNLKNNILKKHLDDMLQNDSLIDLIHEVIGSNPRTIKRFINNLSFALYIAEKKLVEYQKVLVVKTSLIRYIYPKLYNQLEQHPMHLLKIQEFIEKNKLSSDETNIKKTGIGIELVDKWLKGELLATLAKILNINGNITNKFSHENIHKYINLVTTTIKSNTRISEIKKDTIENESVYQKEYNLKEEINNIMINIPDDNVLKYQLLVSQYPITQKLYFSVMKENPSWLKGDDLPVENVSWIDVVRFCNELSKINNLDEVYIIPKEKNIKDRDDIKSDFKKNGFRLPTTEEWEYICRANQENENDRYGDINDIAWYGKNSDGRTHIVGDKLPNKFNIYDMLGNVYEWCDDGPEAIDFKYIKGGSWEDFDTVVQISKKNSYNYKSSKNSIGFRIVSKK